MTQAANLAAVGTNANSSGTLLISGTAVAASSAAVDFTGIPATAKRVTVMFSGVSTSGTSNLLVQIGSGSFTTSGYLGAGSNIAIGAVNFTAGFGSNLFNSATAIVHGSIALSVLNGNTWSANGSLARSDAAAVGTVAGTVALSGTLDRVRITTVSGADTFDAGTINIMWE